MANQESAAWPLADAGLAQELLDMVQQCSHYRQLKKGAVCDIPSGIHVRRFADRSIIFAERGNQVAVPWYLRARDPGRRYPAPVYLASRTSTS